jgi:hypothetical protein
VEDKDEDEVEVEDEDGDEDIGTWSAMPAEMKKTKKGAASARSSYLMSDVNAFPIGLNDGHIPSCQSLADDHHIFVHCPS